MAQQKEFLRGLVAGIKLYPGEHRGVIEFYDLLSLVTGRSDVAASSGRRPASFKFSAGTPEELKKMQVWDAAESFCWRPEGWILAA
jgi:hypothetical protein